MTFDLRLNRAWLVAAVAIMLAFGVPARAQQSRWSAPADATAKSLIDMERQWAQAACTHNGIEKTILAEDFYGTAPDGSPYSKQQEIARSSGKITEEACTLYEVRVHFYGDSMAILYGSESAIHNEPDGRKHRVKLIWTDTWLKRDGKWQIVAAQDMARDVP